MAKLYPSGDHIVPVTPWTTNGVTIFDAHHERVLTMEGMQALHGISGTATLLEHICNAVNKYHEQG